MRWSEEQYAIYLARHQAGPLAPPGPQQELPEARLLSRVTAEARRLGYLVYHTHDSRRSAPGFPDLVLCNGARLLFVELKSRTGKLTPEQSTWLSMLRHTGLVETYLWRPQDWPALAATLRSAPQSRGDSG
jgi:hypothetical protein